MAKLTNIFEFRGTVGDLVGCVGPFGHYVRRRPKAPSKPPTPRQLAVRQRLKLVMAFLTPLKKIVYSGFGNTAKGSRTAAFNRATAHALTHAVAGEYPNQFIIPEGIQLSYGTLPGLVDPKCIFSDGIIRLTWITIWPTFIANGDDVVSLLVYHAGAGRAFLGESERQAGALTVRIDDEPPGSRLLAYAYVRSRFGSYSNSRFLGEFVVEGDGHEE